MTIDIRLDDPTCIPAPLTRALAQQTRLLQSSEFMEELLESEEIRRIAGALGEFIGQHHLIGYHCTKEPGPGYFRTHGLRILDRAAHQAEFLERYADRFSADELAVMREAWAAHFSRQQDDARNGKLWFCLSAHLVVHDGTDRFFEYFGGEAVYWPLTRLPAVAAKLRAIGNPVVVEVRIDPKELRVFRDPAHTALSHFHRRVNPSAYLHECEGYLSRDILPEQVTRVVPKEAFFAEHKRG